MELSYEEEMINERHLSACDLREYFVKEKFLVSSETEVERITTDDEPLFCQRKGRRRRLRREKKIDVSPTWAPADGRPTNERDRLGTN